MQVVGGKQGGGDLAVLDMSGIVDGFLCGAEDEKVGEGRRFPDTSDWPWARIHAPAGAVS